MIRFSIGAQRLASGLIAGAVLLSLAATPSGGAERAPWFCSGCPHNTSTRVPEGSRAVAGIGCHYMAVWMDRSTTTFSQMGGEGVSWVGQQPFTKDKHMSARASPRAGTSPTRCSTTRRWR